MISEVEQDDAVLHDQADEQNAAHEAAHVERRASDQQSEDRADETQRRCEQHHERFDKAAELNDHHGDHAHRRQYEHQQQTRERRLLRGVLPADFETDSLRQWMFREDAADILHHIAECATGDITRQSHQLLLILAQQFGSRVLWREGGDGAEWRGSATGGGDNRKRRQRARVEAHSVRRTHAHLDRAIIEPQLARRNAEQRTAGAGSNLRWRHPQSCRLHTIDRHRQLGARLRVAIIKICQSFHLAHVSREQLAIRLEGDEIRAEQFDLDRLRRAGEIVDDIRQDLHEFHAQARHRGGDRIPHAADDFRRRHVAICIQTHDHVAAILLRRKQAELRTRAPGGGGDLRRAAQQQLDFVDHAIRLVERGAAGRPVVQHERAFVHLRQKSGAGEAICDDSADCECHNRRANQYPVVQHRVERAIVPAFETPGPVPGRFSAREIRSAEQRNHREREHERHQHSDGERHRQRREELSDNTLEQSKRREHDDRRDG